MKAKPIDGSIRRAISEVTDLAVVILTFDEARHIERAIRCVRPIAKQIFVVDFSSTDETVAIARANGAIQLQHRFVNYSKQFQWGWTSADHGRLDDASGRRRGDRSRSRTEIRPSFQALHRTSQASI